MFSIKKIITFPVMWFYINKETLFSDNWKNSDRKCHIMLGNPFLETSNPFCKAFYVYFLHGIIQYKFVSKSQIS